MKISYIEIGDFDFMRWTMNLLLKFNPIISPDPEYIIVSPWRKHDWHDNKKLILITHENYSKFKPHYPLEKYHAVLGLFPPDEPCNFVEFPLIAVHHDVPIEFLYSERKKVLQIPKTEFCCFLTQNQVLGDLTKTRIEFFKKLNEYKQVISGGGISNSLWCRIPRGLHELRWISQFKFMICFENTIKKGYVTEKPFNPWFSGTIPIYAGDFEKLNEKAYINGLAENAIEQVIKIDNDNDLFESMRHEELIKPRISLDNFHKNFEIKVLNKL